MSVSSLRTIDAAARRTVLETSWAQWAALTHTASSGKREVTSVVDAEALVLISLFLQEDERRLRDMLSSMAARYSRFLSVHRAQSLATTFPEPARERLAEFASWATHPSWLRLRKLAVQTDAPPTRDKTISELRLLSPPAIQLRLRTAFGVGLKSDLLTYLLCQHDQPSTLSDLAASLAYTERNTRVAADDLVDAGFAARDDYSAQVTYRAAIGVSSFFLFPSTQKPSRKKESAPRWTPWAVIYAFLAHVADMAQRSMRQQWSTYVVSSKSRDLIEQHYPLLIRARVVEWSGQMVALVDPLSALDRLVAETHDAVVRRL